MATEPIQGPRSLGARLRARAELVGGSPRLLAPIAVRAAVEGLIRLTRQGRRTFFDPAAFPWTETLEAGWRDARDELDAVLDRWEDIPPFQEVQPEQARLTRDDRWRTYVLFGYGRWVERNRRECPRTARLVEGIPGLKAAMFSILAPGKHLPPHRGPYAGVLRYHLGLRVPDAETSGIRVGRDVGRWAEGRSLVFDDSHDHEAWNASSGPRAVLFVDFVRPLPGGLAAINGWILDGIARSAFVRRGQENLDRWYAGRDGRAMDIAREVHVA